MTVIRTCSLTLLIAAGACRTPPQQVAPSSAPPSPSFAAPPASHGVPTLVAGGTAVSAPRTPAPRLSTPRSPAPGRAAAPATVAGLSFADTPLLDALRHLQAVTGAPILVTPAGRDVIAAEDLRVDLDLRASVRVDAVLNLLAATSPNLGWKVDDGVIWFTSQRDARGPLRLRVHDVRDLLMARTDFPAPRIQGLPTGEDRFQTVEEEIVRALEPDQLIALIRSATDPRYWDETEGASLDVTDSGMLLVRADAAMHRRIGSALGTAR